MPAREAGRENGGASFTRGARTTDDQAADLRETVRLRNAATALAVAGGVRSAIIRATAPAGGR
ncbi:hypothetical protein [Actinosynnema mirum]|uniref:Uncharacterized protein n=1 Tax=Actinosynnema mirum (strain ATCC 29888 / DSM 43827 / JCM 3225 / NBRC 14064 / NCIMB 13271 / NRRL B-12336 / IMRU 3971 / 101) TaxID=446462 RepID=C6W9V3_ACTMD|nr:hypothetical protein [Actinosynnema mirum]ACU37320.1 hypothetical protein Amir_3422 [Actinosynnema mirum DSM 43827]